MFTLRAMRTFSTNGRLAAAQRVICAVALSTLAACATRLDQAPVVDRSGGLGAQPSGAVATQSAVPLGPPPPGYYRVKPGDTLYRIALDNGQNYRDIAAWNNLANPNQIEVDQLLRVVPPGANAATATPGVATAPVTNGSAVQAAPIAPSSSSASASGAAVPPTIGGSTATTIPPQPAASATGSAPAAGGTVNLAWPVKGPIIGNFDDSTNKGVNIGGAEGTPIKAAADGRVVYAGNGLRGYGNLIIIKHDATYLTAYAHNRTLMVKEGDSVTKGQKIAEMGSSDASRVMLHFEVRKQGKPVDPMKYLPPQ
ncbi:peptidoglycan DD-metalloendopeptidase family protein [Trinickia caryophylli]|uniref:Lipoprotein NlpD n=1 Tax=Trinickia caryophylli TaxID=28094 RepID=A0A1X7FX71_TRICW|nr:peptidoglycan DD-metalloendopeptidase family protein [Trinickia caryophylli]PMS11725.1 LysM peptidoglycan-binding domain-containing protein [Trinickia caryophylli]TRX20184.1 peptidoglycan DD-metalloendopeptidase family protein [Trinickia caryophylli]WQE13800.1 peptidoglycan DD-metalloendopeptidase family protein [Trinickia caryophylli]SMF60416.1 lipoprotein NlpD [Trinickia caryophylli]GLU34644.1 peptidase [Trinickia caryophylli]